MELFWSFLSLAALAGVCVFLVRRGLAPAGQAPFIALCGTMIWFALGGMLGILRLSGWAYFVLAAGAWAFGIWPKSAKRSWAELKTPGFAAFWGLAALTLIFFAVKQPMFLAWDEFSFWGTAGKIVKYSDALYVNAEIGWDWVGTHRPALIVLGYFFQFFGRYAEWRIMAAYDIFMLSVFLLPASAAKWGQLRRYVPAFFFSALVPFAVTLYGSVTLDTNVYATALSDIPLGVAFGGALAVYFSAPQRRIWPAALALAALCLVKDTGFALALIAAGIIAVDFVWHSLHEKKLPAALAGAAALFVSCGAAFYVWQLYLAAASSADTSNVGGTEEMGMVQMVLTGLRELCGIGRTEKFSRIMGNYIHSFFSVKSTMLGPALIVALLAVCMAAAAAVLTKDKALRGQSIRFAVLGTAGFAAFFVFIGFTYVYVFRAEISDTLIGWERYLYPYLIGWLIAAAAFICRAEENERLPGLTSGGFFVVTAALMGLVYLRLPLNLTVFAGNDSIYSARRESGETAALVQQAVPEDAHIFFVSQGDDGSKWFLYTYELYPWYLDYSGTPGLGGGGTFALPGTPAPDDAIQALYVHYYTADELLQCIRDNGCHYVFVNAADETFRESYGMLFSDELRHAEEPALYAWNEAEQKFDFACSVGAKA